MKSEKDPPEIQSAHAILMLDGKYVLQLRDKKAGIAASGQWSLFGGRIKPGETPLKSIKREVREELSIQPKEYRNLWFTDCYGEFEKTDIRIWYFTADITSVWRQHKLYEGREVRAFRFEQISELDIPGVIYQALERYQRTIVQNEN